jgi:hypothetical protein
MCGQLVVDRAHERFGPRSPSPTARHSFRLQLQLVHIYEAGKGLRRTGASNSTATLGTLEYATGVSARFKDGSTLHISAWANCCDGSGCRHCRG